MSSPATNRRRIHPLIFVVAGLGGAAMLAFIWWTVSPLFINTRVDEAFPTSAAIVQPTAVPAPTDIPAPTAAAPVAAAGSNDSVAPTALPAPTAVPTVAPTAVPSEPIALSVGSFTTIDALHSAEGSATIYRMPDGKLLLRFENFSAQNGPDLFVGLSGHPMPRTSDEVHQNYVELARLTANQGNQNYELPADLDLSSFKSVVIYCKAFSVVFSTAELLD